MIRDEGPNLVGSYYSQTANLLLSRYPVGHFW